MQTPNKNHDSDYLNFYNILLNIFSPELMPLKEAKPSGKSELEKNIVDSTTDADQQELTPSKKDLEVKGEPEKPTKEEIPSQTTPEIR